MAPIIDQFQNCARQFVLALLLLFFAAFPALAIEFPPLTGRVVDLADLLSPDQEAALTAKLQAFEVKSSDQIVVATIPSLNGEVLEDYANKLYRTWALGQKQEDNGVLFLVSRDDRKLRIEVGYGLEGQLTDALSKIIIENTVIPAFRNGDFAGGIAKGTDDIISVVSGDGAELEARAKRNVQSESDAPDTIFVIIFGIFFMLIFGSIVFSMLAHVFGTRIGPRHYRWMGIDIYDSPPSSSGSSGGGWSSGSGGGWSSGGGGFSGGGGSSGGGGASGGW